MSMNLKAQEWATCRTIGASFYTDGLLSPDLLGSLSPFMLRYTAIQGVRFCRWLTRLSA
jgi:hypothetical protein